jgi:hypothetical protein
VDKSKNGWTKQELSGQLLVLELKRDRILLEHRKSEEAIEEAILSVRQEIETLPVALSADR